MRLVEGVAIVFQFKVGDLGTVYWFMYSIIALNGLIYRFQTGTEKRRP